MISLLFHVLCCFPLYFLAMRLEESVLTRLIQEELVCHGENVDLFSGHCGLLRGLLKCSAVCSSISMIKISFIQL